MSDALEVAAIGMRVQQRALDAIANNVSNVNTPAFKRSELRFAELVSPAAEARRTGDASPLRSDSVAGVEMWTLPLIDRQGQIEATGNPRDIAIDGPGFVELMGPAGRVRSMLPKKVQLIALQDKYAMRQKISVNFLRTRERDPNLLALLATCRSYKAEVD